MAVATITTQAVSGVTLSGCTGNGNITVTGGANSTRRGFCYKAGTTGDPIITDSIAYDDGDFGTGAFTKAITSLSPATGYRVRAYATNPSGTGYGTTVQLTTSASGIYPYSLTNILVSVRALLQEATASFWTDAILTAYINEAIKTIAQKTGCYRTITTADTIALTRVVSFTGYKCIAVEYSNTALIKITPLQIGHVPIDGIYPQYWFESGSVIGIEPIPPAIYTLTLYLASAPADLASGSDAPVIPYSMCNLITYFAASRALEQDQKFDAALMMMNIFSNELEFMSQAISNIPDGTENLRMQ